MRFLPIIVCASLAPSLCGQNIWVVDIANGAGTHFVSLTAAFAAAPVVDGDVLLVRQGTYGAAATSKALTVLGSPTASIVALSFANATSSRPVVLKNLVISSVGSQVALELRALPGGAHLENVDATTTMYPGTRTTSPLQIVACPLVTLVRVRASGGELSTSLASSIVFASGCDFTGQTGGTVHQILYGRTTPALVIAKDAFAYLASTSATGGAGVFLGMYGLEAPAPAIRCAGVLRVAADASAVIAAGAAGPSVTPASAIDCTLADVRVDPDVTLTPRNGAPPIACAATIAQMPALRGSGAPPSGVASLDYVSVAGNSFALWLALPATPAITPFGVFALDLTTITTVTAGIVPPVGSVALTLPVPNLTLLRGLAVAVQAVDVSSPANLQLSNVVAIVLH